MRAVRSSEPLSAGNGHDPVSQYEFYATLDLDKPSCPDRTTVLLELLRDAVSMRGGVSRVLDLGCGEGFQAALAREVVAPATVLGVDWSAGALRRAKGRRLSLVQAGVDGRDLPFPDGSFDVVIFSEVIEHLVDTDHAISEIRRILVDDGILLISTPNLAAWFNRLLLLIGVQPLFSEVSRVRIFGRPGQQVAGHLRIFTYRALREFLEAQGVAIHAVRGAAYHQLPRPARVIDRFMRRWPSAAAVLVVSARKTPLAPRPKADGGTLLGP